MSPGCVLFDGRLCARPAALRPLGHVLFPAPMSPRFRWVLDAPGHREDGNPVPEKFIRDIVKKGSIALPAGVYNVVWKCGEQGESPKWVLDAPGHKEHGHPVPDKFLGDVISDSKQGSLSLAAGNFSVVKRTSALTRRRVSFNVVSEEVPVSPRVGSGWVFDAPGYKEHGSEVPESLVDQIQCTGTLPRLALPGGCFTVAQLPESEGSGSRWVLHAPGHHQDGQKVPKKFVSGIDLRAKKGTLCLAGGTFTVLQRPRPPYRRGGSQVPVKRTMSEILKGNHFSAAMPLLRRVRTLPSSL